MITNFVPVPFNGSFLRWDYRIDPSINQLIMTGLSLISSIKVNLVNVGFYLVE